MKRIIRTALAAVMLSGLTAVAGCYLPPGSGVFVVRRPPPRPHEYIGSRPGPGYAWIVGYWGWTGGDYVWYPGRWEPIPRGYHEWVPGRWHHDRRGWYRHEGHWR